MTEEEFEKKMKDKPEGSEGYKNFFNKEIKHPAGYWDYIGKKFYDVGEDYCIWLAYGRTATFKNNV
jgi:hypothetical protein